MDRNGYYGAETASLSLQNLFQKFRNGPVAGPLTETAARDWNVDLVPKFIMACGNLVKILLHCKVTHYLEFKSIDASYVYKDGKVHKIPTTMGEILSSGLLSFWDKRSFYNFLDFVQKYDETNPKTWKSGKRLDDWTSRDLFKAFSLAEYTKTFLSHAMALHLNDDFMDKPATETCEAIKLYVYSLLTYGNSPYIYPLYGLGGLPEGFSRLCAIHGGTFMLNRSVDKVLEKDGVAWGIQADNLVAKAKHIIGDPSYFEEIKMQSTSKTIRSICVLDHPIKGTDNVDSVQIIIPAVAVGRKNDIYVCMVSNGHCVAAKGLYTAIVSTTVETNDPKAEIQPGIELLGSITERFDNISDGFSPLKDGKSDNCYITNTYDATSHFETVADDVLDMYYRITGEKLDLNINADSTESPN